MQKVSQAEAAAANKKVHKTGGEWKNFMLISLFLNDGITQFFSLASWVFSHFRPEPTDKWRQKLEGKCVTWGVRSGWYDNLQHWRARKVATGCESNVTQARKVMAPGMQSNLKRNSSWHCFLLKAVMIYEDFPGLDYPKNHEYYILKKLTYFLV